MVVSFEIKRMFKLNSSIAVDQVRKKKIMQVARQQAALQPLVIGEFGLSP